MAAAITHTKKKWHILYILMEVNNNIYGGVLLEISNLTLIKQQFTEDVEIRAAHK